MDKTQTERLCDLFDERGISYTTMMCPHGIVVVWKDAHGNEWEAADDGSGGLDVIPLDVLTPEQAIEATLGRGECHIEERHGDLYCSGCNELIGTFDPTSELYVDGNAVDMWHYCPNCGRKLVDA